MLKKIESLRKKPKHVRNQYAFWIAFIFTSFVVIVWVVSLPEKFSINSERSDEDSEELSKFMDMFGNIQNDVSDTFKDIQEQTKELQAVSEATSTEMEKSSDTLSNSSTSQKTNENETFVLIGTTTSASATFGE